MCEEYILTVLRTSNLNMAYIFSYILVFLVKKHHFVKPLAFHA